eukprot:XP_001185249.3 PREDICTED: uncharacterized protein LOC754339 [Strongylocentrotus purpuratus]
MSHFLNTYSRLKPVSKKADVDEFSELLRYAAAKRKTKVTALKSIAESETGDQDEGYMAETFQATMKRTSKPISQKSSRRKPTPLKIEGKRLGGRHYSPMARTSLHEDPSDEIDDSIVYLSDFLEENTTLSDAETTLTNAETCEDSDNEYSDIEVPRDLPEQKRKSSTISSRILKLTQMSNKRAPYMKSQSKGNGPQNYSRESSSSYSVLGQGSPNGNKKRSTSKIFSGGHNLSEKGKTLQTTTRSVYSLLSEESDTSLTGSPSQKKGNEPKLKVTGKKVPLVKKSPAKTTQLHHDSIGELCGKDGKKQVSFQLKTKPKVFDPVDPSMSTPFNVSLPHCSSSNSILKKTAVVELSDAANGKATRATSTPQKSSTHSRKTHGCHIMDLSFDVSAVSLPLDNDLVITKKPMNHDKIQEVKRDRKSEGPGETTENLLDFEPMCLQASQSIGSVLETQVKDDRRKHNEMTPSTQMKRQSPEAGTPSKQLPKKSRILKPSKDGGLGNRKRLNYQQPGASVPTPECSITTLPFPGYNLHPSIEQKPPLQGHVNMRHIRQHPQDILETIPDRAFLHLKSAIGYHS